MEMMPVNLAGEAVELHADRALFWPARARLVIADLHLGKGDIFRRHGIAVPSGGTGGDLARLDALIARTGAAELWVLGDMLHGDPAGSRWRAAWSAFRAAHRDLAIRVIAGNHDRALHAAASIATGRSNSAMPRRRAPARTCSAATCTRCCGWRRCGGNSRRSCSIRTRRSCRHSPCSPAAGRRTRARTPWWLASTGHWYPSRPLHIRDRDGAHTASTRSRHTGVPTGGTERADT